MGGQHSDSLYIPSTSYSRKSSALGSSSNDTADHYNTSQSDDSALSSLFEMDSSDGSNMDGGSNVYMFKLNKDDDEYGQTSESPSTPDDKLNDELMYLLQEPEVQNSTSPPYELGKIGIDHRD
jgi:hypothetical protein